MPKNVEQRTNKAITPDQESSDLSVVDGESDGGRLSMIDRGEESALGATIDPGHVESGTSAFRAAPIDGSPEAFVRGDDATGGSTALRDGSWEQREEQMSLAGTSDDTPLAGASIDRDAHLRALNADDASGDSVQGLSADRDDALRSRSADTGDSDVAMGNPDTYNTPTEF